MTDEQTEVKEGDSKETGTEPSDDHTSTEVPTEKELNKEVEEGSKVTLKHLEELEKRLKAEVAHSRKDAQADADEKAQLREELTRVSAAVEALTKRLENEGERPDNSTVVIPPSELDPPTNPAPDESSTGGSDGDSETGERKRRNPLRYY